MVSDRAKQRIEDAAIDGMPQPMSAEEIALRGGDPSFERFIAKQEALRDEEAEDESE